MNSSNKEIFIKSMMGIMLEVFLSDVQKMPESWDGYEIRTYIAKAFNHECETMAKERMKKFGAECVAWGLSYHGRNT
jgi:hypothetical protein